VVWHQNHRDNFLWFGVKTDGDGFFGLALKSVATVSPGLTAKPVAQISSFGPQNRQLRFGDLGLKIGATIFWFEPQNQAGFTLSVAP
jgi:hypothetical protein